MWVWRVWGSEFAKLFQRNFQNSNPRKFRPLKFLRYTVYGTLNLIYRQAHASHLRKGRRVLEGVASKTSMKPEYEVIMLKIKFGMLN